MNSDDIGREAAEHFQVFLWLQANHAWMVELPELDYTTWDGESRTYRDPVRQEEEASYVTLSVYAPTIQFSCHGPRSKQLMTDIRRRLGGKWEKSGYYGGTFALQRELKDDGDTYRCLTIRIQGPREQVCTARQTGTRTVTRPDPNAPKIEVEEPIIEWDCDPILAGEGDAA